MKMFISPSLSSYKNIVQTGHRQVMQIGKDRYFNDFPVLQASQIMPKYQLGKTKSVAFSESGLRESQRLLTELFATVDEEG